jgi:periplasmic protein CpxP/Spy
MRRMVKLILALIIVLMAGNETRAQQRSENHQQAPGKNTGKGMRQSMNLTEAQINQMKNMRLKMMQATLPIRNQLGENRARLRTLSTAENVDMRAIDKIIDSNSQLKGKMTKIWAANHQAVRKLLTEEQRIIFDSRDFQQMRRKFQGQKRQHGKSEMRSGHRQGSGRQGK